MSRNAVSGVAYDPAVTFDVPDEEAEELEDGELADAGLDDVPLPALGDDEDETAP